MTIAKINKKVSLGNENTNYFPIHNTNYVQKEEKETKTKLK